MRRALALLLTLLPTTAAADEHGGTVPSGAYTPDQVGAIISAEMGVGKAQNQPSMIDGYLMLAGNAQFELWDIEDPFDPTLLSAFDSPHGISEAESHSVTFHKRDGRTYAATISGIGVDLWDLTDPTAPVLLHDIDLEGVNYGDNSEAVWGVFWQGDALYVGGTNTGIHVVDTSDLTAPTVRTRVPTAEFGGVSAGPLWAIGNLLVVTPPKDHTGIATLDISDPWAPSVLDFDTSGDDSYIGGFYGDTVYLLTPFRAFDVTTDPADIRLLHETPQSDIEYLSFADGHVFLGAMRPEPGVEKHRLTDDGIAFVSKVEGRRDDKLGGRFTDDQFATPVGNLLVMGDDEIRYGAVLAVHAAAPDLIPPDVAYVNPPDGAAGQAVTTRVGVSFTDAIDLRTVDPTTLVVRPLDGEPLDGSWGLNQTILTFDPAEPLAEDTAYEIVVTAGGITDLVGNAVAVEHRSVFSTGADVPTLPCAITPGPPSLVTAGVELAAEPVEGAAYRFDFGDGNTLDLGPQVTHAWQSPGRKRVTLTVTVDGRSRSCAAIQIVHEAPAQDVASSSNVAVDGRTAWVANPDAGTVTAIDLDALAVTSEVDVCATPRSVAVEAPGVLWVACEDDQVVILADGSVDGRVPVPHGWAPHGVVFGAPGSVPDVPRAYVSMEGLGRVVELTGRVLPSDPVLAGGPVVASHPPRAPLGGLAVRGDSVYASTFISPGEVGLVGLPAATLAMDPGPDEHDGGRGLPNLLGPPAVSPMGLRVAVPSTKANIERGLARDGEPLDADNTVRAIVSFLDGPDSAEDADARVDLDDHDSPAAALFGPSGTLVFVASRGTNRVDALDAYTGDAIAAFATGLGPTGLALADGLLVVNNELERTASIVDVRGILDGTDPVGRTLAVVPTVAVEPLLADVLLGKQIFNNASSREMSQDGYLSCATCHPSGGHDGVTWDFTDRGEGLRNTIDLRGKAGTGHGPVHWTANFDEIQDFENDIRNAFGGSGLMPTEDFEISEDPLGFLKAGVSPRLDALAAYVASLDSFPRSPYRTADGRLTEQAERGRTLLERRDCLTCHSGPTLTDSAPGVRHDVGTATDLSGGRIGGPLDGFDTPTLFGLFATAPYFHDGSAATLQDVLDRPGHGNAQNLRQEDKDALAAYLLQLEPDQLPLEAGCACSAAEERGAGPAWLLAALLWARRRRPIRRS